ncbi:MAG: 16S rRNA (guanine(966)-N(2))-methyltransferase RsmD [Gammaproteobacteria bacterium]|nr:16S rRNA (guanine(966)-N(2))-methyltransferase RsmD [Gammaproteobacteria bacterium]MYD80479.1 16S rRNA (guanine(966)-N(2))-methyltransferase RsmD [Gammaproteobacteria bacterium]
MKHSLRIIGGKWRGHRLKVPSSKAIRPTPDAVRETLFNWLGSSVVGARVVDLFAGTGSLGFEALSRGAAHATFVERNRHSVSLLRKACHKFDLDATEASVISANSIGWLKSNTNKWDIVFVDPPFERTEIYRKVLTDLLSRLSTESIVYLEFSKRSAIDRLDYKMWKSSVTGEVQFELLRPPNTLCGPANIVSDKS